MFRAGLERALASRLAELDGVDVTATPVILCSWRRPERIADVIADLDAQGDAGRLLLVIWNNHRGTERGIVAQVAAWRAHRDEGSALSDVRVITSRRNIGGIARFVVARRLRRLGARGPVVTVDDDMRLGTTFVSALLAAWSERSVVGVWAWRVVHGYWGRAPLADGEAADYVGTGGCAFDGSIVDDVEFFDRLPDRFGSIEDVWMSRWAAVRGWRLEKVEAPHSFSDDGHAQYQALHDRKEELWSIADALARGEQLDVEPDPSATLRQVSAGEIMRLRVRGATRRLRALARR